MLAAGGSTRMGRPKALLEVDGVPLVVHHARAFAALGLRVSVVLGAHSPAVAAMLDATVRVVINPDWASTDPAWSAYLGLQACGPALFTPVDVPPARTADLLRLCAGEGPAVLAYRGHPGHPVRLEPPHAHLRLDERLRDARLVEVEDPTRLANLNTPAQWEAWLADRARLRS